MRKAIVLSRVSTLQQDLRQQTEEILREVYKEEGGLVIEEGKSGGGGAVFGYTTNCNHLVYVWHTFGKCWVNPPTIFSMKQTKKNHLTAENGRPIADNQNTQTAGVRGPVTMQDPWLVEKLAHFDREVIPERRMHAKGSGAYGTFTVTHDITPYTRASIFAEVGKQTDCFVRFSTVAGERGAADAERDIRGFAMKFYTDTGNWDLVGNNTPVFFLRDPLKFPDLNHAIKRDPRTGMRSANSNWDFWTLLPEALHQVTITMSPRGIPLSYRHMHGFGSHTYSFINADNRRTWVKFHLRTLQGIKNMTDAEAEAVIAKDRESHQRDLFEAIERGDYPRWLMQV